MLGVVVIPFDGAVQVRPSSIVGQSRHSGARVKRANPESRDSGSGPSDHPGMTAIKLENHMKPKTLFALAALLATTLAARADVVRHPIPNTTFPIALAVQVPATATTT